MKQEKGITMVALVVTIIILIILAGISINVTIGDNGLITKAKQTKQNIVLAGEAEALQLNQLYFDLEASGGLTEDEESTKKDEIIALLQKQVEELLNQVANLQTENEELKKQIQDLTTQIAQLQQEIEDLKQQIINKDIELAELKKQVAEKEDKIKELQEQLDSLNSLLSQTNATADKILAGYKAYSGGKLLTGTMPNNGSLNSSLNCGQNFTIPSGYTSGGTITANSLASQTPGTATGNNLSAGTTAWVNGQLITGNGADVNNAVGNITGALFGGKTKTASIPCSTSTNSNVAVHSSYSPLWTESIANNVGKSNPIYLLKDTDGNAAIANTITISYTCGGSQAYGQEYSYNQVIQLKDEAGNVLDTIQNGNSSKTWNLFTLPISGSYVYIEYTLYARVRYTTSNKDGQAYAHATMSTPSVIYLYAE